MKTRLLTILMALGMVASSNAFADASRASVAVMGQGDAGLFLPQDTSFSYDNGRNIFYNPSYVNDYKNFGIIEKSNFPANTGEGGMVETMGQFAVGIYLNRGDELAAPATLGTGTSLGFAGANNMHPIDVIVGSDMGSLKWGLGLNFATFSAGGSHNSNNSLMLRAGIQMMDFEPFAWYRVIAEQKFAANNDVDQTVPSMGIGVRYKMGEWTPFAGYEQNKLHDNTAGADVFKQTAWILGLGRTMKIAEGARMNHSIAIVHSTSTSGVNGVGNVVPINVSVEDDATSWMTVRAGLGFNWWDQNGGVTIADNTTARLGASLHMGKADFDFAVGRAQNPGTTNEFEGTETGGNLKDSQTFDIAAGFFTAASVQYHW